jgi:endonuclease YncB( thermonuclease family)
MKAGWWALLALLLAPALHAATFRATVSHVTDGDTLWVRRSGGGAPVPLRLLDIDAPEACQAFGPQAKQALRQRALRRVVVVRTRGQDDYARTLAQVDVRGEDLGAWLVRNGYAWSATFRGRPGPYAALEARARAERRGLWAQPVALEPRRFRQRFGRCR